MRVSPTNSNYRSLFSRVVPESVIPSRACVSAFTTSAFVGSGSVALATLLAPFYVAKTAESFLHQVYEQPIVATKDFLTNLVSGSVSAAYLISFSFLFGGYKGFEIGEKLGVAASLRDGAQFLFHVKNDIIDQLLEDAPDSNPQSPLGKPGFSLQSLH